MIAAQSPMLAEFSKTISPQLATELMPYCPWITRENIQTVMSVLAVIIAVIALGIGIKNQ